MAAARGATFRAITMLQVTAGARQRQRFNDIGLALLWHVVEDRRCSIPVPGASYLGRASTSLVTSGVEHRRGGRAWRLTTMVRLGLREGQHAIQEVAQRGAVVAVRDGFVGGRCSKLAMAGPVE